MKINVKGDTPLQRLTNFVRGVIAVPKSEVERMGNDRNRKKHLATKKRKLATR
jgi:hypothetical protein